MVRNLTEVSNRCFEKKGDFFSKQGLQTKNPRVLDEPWLHHQKKVELSKGWDISEEGGSSVVINGVMDLYKMTLSMDKW